MRLVAGALAAVWVALAASGRGETASSASERWRALSASTLARTEVAVARAGSSAYVVGAFYALAGRAAGRGNFKVVERYVDGHWERLPSMRKARGGIAAATVNRQVVVVGGEEGAGTIGEVEAFDPRSRPVCPRRAMTRCRGVRRADLHFEGGPEPGLFYSGVTEALGVPS
jgi:hypothetical protein